MNAEQFKLLMRSVREGGVILFLARIVPLIRLQICPSFSRNRRAITLNALMAFCTSQFQATSRGCTSVGKLDNYGAKTYRFGLNLEQAEAKQIIRAIQEFIARPVQ
jgi:hypothetical protein